MKKFTYILSVLLLTSIFGCKSEHDNPLDIPPEAVYDIVTLKSTGNTGSVFTMQVNGDSPIIEYTAPYDLSKSESVKEGSRLTLCYNREGGDTYTSGKIMIYGYSTMTNTEQDVITTETDKYAGFSSQPLEISAIWRTGQYVNLQLSLYVTQAKRPKTFVMVADEATLSDAYPTVYLIYENVDDNNGLNKYAVRASFDISSIWNLESCKGVRVCYRTPTSTAVEIIDKIEI